MSNVPLKDLKYSRFYVRSVYCSWKSFSDLNQNGCEIVRATVTPELVYVLSGPMHANIVCVLSAPNTDQEQHTWILLVNLLFSPFRHLSPH